MGNWIDHAALLMAAAILAPAVVMDIRERRIPNTLCLGGLVAALVLHWATDGNGAALIALGGGLLLVGITVPLYAHGWLGAGDIKLMAAMGAMAGTPPVALAMLAAIAIAGGFLAVYRHYSERRAAPVTVAQKPGSPPGAGFDDVHAFPTRPRGLPYAVAIAVGSLTVLVAQALEAA